MSDENKKYVPEGVYLVCNQGAVPTRLICKPHPIELYDVRYADENDHKPLVNIPSFGACKVSPSGTCLPPILRWTKYKEDFLMHGFHPLLEDSECVCTAGGIIKIYFDEYEASVAAANNGESGFAKEPISNFVLGMIGGFPFSMFSPDFRDGVGTGLKQGLEGTWNFLTQAATHPLDTLGGTLKMAVIASVYGTNAVNPLGILQSELQLRMMDAAFGTDLIATRDGLAQGLGKGVGHVFEDFRRGNMREIGKDAGQVEYAVIEAVVGSKGTGLAMRGAKMAAETAVLAQSVSSRILI